MSLIRDRPGAAARYFSLCSQLAIATVVGQTILWWCGFRLQGPGKTVQGRAVNPSRLQFSLGTLLRTVAVVALLLGLVRWFGLSDTRYLEFAAILGAVAALAVALVWIRGYLLFRVGAGVLVVGGCAAASLCSGPIHHIYPALMLSRWLAMLVFTTASLAVFRVCGYRLEWIPRARIEASVNLPNVDETANPSAMSAESRL
jgi:hypothetical protein